MIKLYGIPNCNKIRNTRKILEKLRIEYEFVNVRKNPIAREKLKSIISVVGIDNIFNTKGTTFRRLNLDYRKMSAEDRFNTLLREQSMIKRPLIENAGKHHVGFDESAIESFVS